MSFAVAVWHKQRKTWRVARTYDIRGVAERYAGLVIAGGGFAQVQEVAPAPFERDPRQLELFQEKGALTERLASFPNRSERKSNVRVA